MWKQFLLPPLNLLVLIVLGALMRRRWPRVGLVCLVVGIVGLYGLSTPLAAHLLLSGLERHPAIDATSDLGGAEAIVVLAAGRRHVNPEYGAETVDMLTLERLRYAAHLHRRTGLPLLVSGGGEIEPDQTALAALMRRSLAQDYGIDVRWIEAESGNTAENAANSARILSSDGVESALVVTHAWHMPRAVLAFRGQPLTIVPAPTAFAAATPFQWPGRLGDYLPNAGALQASSFAMHEWLGLLWYAIRYG